MEPNGLAVWLLKVTFVRELERQEEGGKDGETVRTIPMRTPRGVEPRRCALSTMLDTTLILPKAERKVVKVRAVGKAQEVVVKVSLSRKTSPQAYEAALAAPAATMRRWATTLIGRDADGDLGDIFGPGGKPHEYAGQGGGASQIRGYWRMKIPAAKKFVAVSGHSAKLGAGEERTRVYVQPFSWPAVGMKPTGMKRNISEALAEKDDRAATSDDFEEKLEAIAKYAGPLGLGLGDLGQVALRYSEDAEEKADSRKG